MIFYSTKGEVISDMFDYEQDMIDSVPHDWLKVGAPTLVANQLFDVNK